MSQDEHPELSRSTRACFDNPLVHKILTKEDVAAIFCVSVKTVERMIADSSLPHHYVGVKPRFHLDEVVQAFRNDLLDFYRRQNDQKNNQQGWNSSLSSARQSQGAKTLPEIRLAAGGHSMG